MARCLLPPALTRCRPTLGQQSSLWLSRVKQAASMMYFAQRHAKLTPFLTGLEHTRKSPFRWYHCSSAVTGKSPKTWSSWDALEGIGNIVLMGLPGSGKTTTGRILSERMGKPALDVDDDLLTPYWGMSVADKLAQVGDHVFLEEEGRALLTLDKQATIVSLSGSNPLHHDSMAKVAGTGVVIYLDAATETILGRQESMKVDRIIGMSDGATLEEVIETRRNFYEMWHDVRVFVHAQDSPSIVADRVQAALSRFLEDVGHVSTRDVTGKETRSTFLEAVLQGLAPDGGLFVKPSQRPKFSMDDLQALLNMTIKERALRILEAWIHPLDISPQELRHFLDMSYTRGLFDHPRMCPLVSLTKNVYTQELFHGPTASFKDWALQLMPRFFTRAAKELQPGQRFLVIAATSGDTGSATLDGFSRHVGVDGDFDYCQHTVKKIFLDKNFHQALGDCQLSVANSINWGRLLPQILYHVTAYLDLVKDGQVTLGEPVDYCIPTGNFGNILSAYYAKILQQLQTVFRAGFATEEDTLSTMKDIFNETGYLLDPHTAVGYHVATNMGTPEVPTVLAGTAHYAKFVDNILPVLDNTKQDYHNLTVGELLNAASGLTDQPKMHSLLSSVASKPVKQTETVSADYAQICNSILQFARSI
ncbi:threonine synthase-like 1 [Elysia marginata]|uniref:Threonine synthase-like 1 n=1 Tax=Elysia marginata TaxID=1093978 RepID=A0AAV4HIL8_9GAST|nr:threonine synthase-like 1 [Elysia marginata]